MLRQSDLDLLKRAKDGDQEAKFELFWTRYDAIHGYVEAKIPHWLRAKVEAEDILQEVFASAYQNLHRFEPRENGSVDRWLRTIAVRKLIDVVRAHKSAGRGGNVRHVRADRQPSDGYRPILELLAGANRSPSSEVAAVEATEAIRDAVETLTSQHQDAINLRYVRGLSLRDVAVEMGTSRGAVSMVLNRAMKQLRNRLGNMSRFLDR